MTDRILEIMKYNALRPSSSILQEGRELLKTSDRYSPIDHLGIIETFNKNNWFITGYQQVKPHTNSRGKYVRWLATYQNPDFEPAGDEAIPLILHQGSHDGSKPLVLNFGLFNVPKLNSLVVGEGTFTPIYHKHIGDVPDNLEESVNKVLSATQNVFSAIGLLQSSMLSPEQVIEFMEKAVAKRFPPEKYDIPDYGPVLGDVKGNLWKLLNQIQDVLITSKNLQVTIKESCKTRKAKALNNIEASILLRKSLWNLALEYTAVDFKK